MNPQWQPIDTVPLHLKKDAIDIFLAKFDDTYGPIYGVGFWAGPKGYKTWKSVNLIRPTHWMPIIPLTYN